jgi:hypothetical protein
MAFAFVVLASNSPDAPGNFAAVKPADRNQLRRTEAITALRQFARNRRLPVPYLWSRDQQPSPLRTTTRQSAGRWDMLLA